MSKKEFISLQFNRHYWEVFNLGENELLLTLREPVDIEVIHTSALLIEDRLGNNLTDLVLSYQSIAIFTDLPIHLLIDQLEGQFAAEIFQMEDTKAMLPICYEVEDTDIDMIATHAGLSIDEVIEIHLSGTYRSLFVGFTPGFIYADGLDPRLYCPRKATPRTKVGAGSVGIGGNQTGIYSLVSPGGWNILGRTPVALFNPAKMPPMNIQMGAKFSFERISKAQFEAWEK